ncbi:MAG: phosphoribosyl-AMP cyclohydrolase [Prolixibacteraceae bacterium]|nr:phosphoribosyl-AMP cyclohydrolase [Burkholderiales bacterium]
MSDSWLDELAFDGDGLIPAVAQETGTGKLLMLAWMNREALRETVRSGRAVYWSRSRQRLWHKGEESGHVQLIKQVRLDCDADVIVLEVEQIGGVACHTGHARCFYRQLDEGVWVETEPVVKDPGEIYDSKP